MASCWWAGARGWVDRRIALKAYQLRSFKSDDPEMRVTAVETVVPDRVRDYCRRQIAAVEEAVARLDGGGIACDEAKAAIGTMTSLLAENRLAELHRTLFSVVVREAVDKAKNFANFAEQADMIRRAPGKRVFDICDNHFGGKHEILEQVLMRSHEKFDQVMAGEEFVRGPIEKRVERFVNAAWEHYRGDEYMATLEILLASRAESGTGAKIKLNHQSHLALWRRIFFDSPISDRAMQDAIYTVHCLLTGYVIEQVLEPESFDIKRHLLRLRLILLAMLKEG